MSRVTAMVRRVARVRHALEPVSYNCAGARDELIAKLLAHVAPVAPEQRAPMNKPLDEKTRIAFAGIKQMLAENVERAQRRR